VSPDAVDAPVLTRRLAAFVTALHAIHPAEVPGVPTHPPRDRLKERYRERWHDVRGILPAAIASRGDAFFAAPSPAEAAITLRLVHADVTYDHVLLRPDGSDVAGVIDWGDLAFADPAWDFAGMFAWFGEAFARQMMDAYGVDVDADLFERSRRGGIYCSVSALWWGQAGGRPRDVAAGTRGLELTLPPV
jgi:aminoglycoside 2''-phosphotransferase